MGLRVHVVDDDAAVRASVAAVLEAAGHAPIEHASGEAFLDAGAAGRAEVVLLDLVMPGRGGLDILSAMRAGGTDASVVMLSGHADVPLAVKAMQLGAADFIEKPADPERLLQAVAAAAERAPTSDDADVALARAQVEKLTSREREVLARLAAGDSNKLAARALGISPRTVEVHRANLMQKMGARSLADLVRAALAAGVH
jgi:two-component system, LuxR family, response regulator FixJ